MRCNSYKEDPSQQKSDNQFHKLVWNGLYGHFKKINGNEVNVMRFGTWQKKSYLSGGTVMTELDRKLPNSPRTGVLL